MIGSGDSGKTTIVNHLKLLDSVDLIENEMNLYKSKIQENVVKVTADTFDYLNSKNLIKIEFNLNYGPIFVNLLKTEPDLQMESLNTAEFIFSFWKEPEIEKNLDLIIKETHLSYNQMK